MYILCTYFISCFWHLQWNLPEWPALLSNHLIKILIGSFVRQIATHVLISETSHTRPPKPDIKGGCLQEVPLYLVVVINIALQVWNSF